MDITVVGHNAEIGSHLRNYIESKAVKVEQFDLRVQYVEVEVTHKRNPHQTDIAKRAEIIVVLKGPTIRAETSSSDRFTASDIAMGKLTERLRRARDRRKDHHRRHTVVASDGNLQAAPDAEVPLVPDTGDMPIEDSPSAPTKPGAAIEAQLGDSPAIVRQGLYEVKPVIIDETLYQMELVGHPFYLFIKKSSK